MIFQPSDIDSRQGILVKMKDICCNRGKPMAKAIKKEIYNCELSGDR